jgi:hypothetical protein
LQTSSSNLKIVANADGTLSTVTVGAATTSTTTTTVYPPCGSHGVCMTLRQAGRTFNGLLVIPFLKLSFDKVLLLLCFVALLFGRRLTMTTGMLIEFKAACVTLVIQVMIVHLGHVQWEEIQLWHLPSMIVMKNLF